MHAQLIIHNLQIAAKIGWPDEERQTPQKLLVSVEMNYPSLPLACTTDELTQTLCYDRLCHQIHEFAAGSSFRLIEAFNYSLYQFIQSLLPEKTSLKLLIQKFPNIKGLEQGVSFILSEEISS